LTKKYSILKITAKAKSVFKESNLAEFLLITKRSNTLYRDA
jgi:hypothetical protein